MPLIKANGINLYYEIHGQDNAGIPLLMIMGTGGDCNHWAGQLAAFAEQHQVIIFDSRGVGKSEQPAGEYSAKLMAEDTVGLMQALGIEKAHILGFSLGGYIAQNIALDFPDKVQSLLLCHSAAKSPARSNLIGKTLLKLVELQVPDDLRAQVFLPWVFSANFMEDSVKMGGLLERAENKANPQSKAGYIGQVFAVITHNLSDRVSQIQAPTLCMTAENDLITPVHCSQALAQEIPGSELVILPEAGHCAYIEDAPAFNREVLAFLKNL